jgi:hypothetical protein
MIDQVHLGLLWQDNLIKKNEHVDEDQAPGHIRRRRVTYLFITDRKHLLTLLISIRRSKRKAYSFFTL